MYQSAILVPISLFAATALIIWIYIVNRNKERMALIEKGAEASIFYNKDRRLTPAWKIIIVNLALLLMGIGAGVFIAGILETVGVEENVAYPGTIFFMAGLGLFMAYNLLKKPSKEN